ncbi:Imm50 family immunity protein [Glycomyces terrestris]|uniref:Imm50 family immunity protein n=1 Tax=Glycomyces terrestris TaxID=2493553 RepID=UPI0013155927|nr:Imm50 family immunity protein [Glycomyces terrestris]
MQWTDHVDLSEGVLKVFGGRAPNLDRVEIREVVIEDGRMIRLRFDLAEYPEHPPAKWAAREANTVQIDLGLGDLSQLAVTGVLEPAVGDVTIAAVSPGGVAVTAAVRAFRLEAAGTFAWIRRCSAYTRGTSL